jgi:hypothetical protein
MNKNRKVRNLLFSAMDKIKTSFTAFILSNRALERKRPEAVMPHSSGVKICRYARNSVGTSSSGLI